MHPRLQGLHDNIRSVFVGKEEAVRLTIAALLARGHVLIEDAPGLGKTLLARSLARSIDGCFQRLQFTPDLLPSDITGVSIYDPAARTFQFIPGPVFTQVLLADEINRGSPRTQSALLETMEERQVTVEGQSRPLPQPFFVLATQNPVELGGTYPLPEAQLDRFLVRISLGYPTAEDEAEILGLHLRGAMSVELRPVLDAAELLALQELAMAMPVAAPIIDYIVAIVRATREHPDVALGASPRASVALMHAAQALAFTNGAAFVDPDVVKSVAPYVLSHRIVIKAQRELSGASAENLLQEILEELSVPVPETVDEDRVDRVRG